MSSHESHARSSCWKLTLLLTALVALALLLNNAQHLFRTELFEDGDFAANSLAVRNAKSFRELHGNYSRWGFHHPGPAFFYCEALGEALLYDATRTVPTPYNAQLVATVVVMAFFFSAALAVCCRRAAPRGAGLWVLPLAALFAVGHFGAIGAEPFLNNWPPWVVVVPFLSLLVAGASVAAGNGEDLPLLVLAGGFLVHGHVAQALFVVPLAALAYGRLVFSGNPEPTPWRRLTSAARAFPRAHLVALVLLGLFLLPLVLDAVQGRDSNLAIILEHIRAHRGENKKFLRSLCYFLQFGAYSSYAPGSNRFERYSAAGMFAFIALHWRAYALWGAALVSLPTVWLLRRAHVQSNTNSSRRRPGFPGWLGVFLAAAFLLTLVWGMKQDGDMYYFNAYFDYALIFGLALLAAVVWAEWAAHALAGLETRRSRIARISLLAVLWIAVGIAAALRADAFRTNTFAGSGSRTAAASVRRALDFHSNPALRKFLSFEHDAWGSAVTTVLALDRHGHRAVVTDNWKTLFGKRFTVSGQPPGVEPPTVVWRIVKPVPPSAAPSAGLPALPLFDDYGFDLEISDLDPAGGEILFSKGGNAARYVRYGWTMPDADWCWSAMREAVLDFRPLPTRGGDVEMLVDAAAFSAEWRIGSQRVDLFFDTTPLGSITLFAEGGGVARKPATVRIPASLWNAASANANSATLQFRFPDAASPAQFGLGSDSRPLGGAFYALRFRVVSPDTR